MEVESDAPSVAVPYDALLALAGVEDSRPHVARCLLINPPTDLVDLVAEWAVGAIVSSGIRPSHVADAVAIRMSAIQRVRPERQRLAERLHQSGITLDTASNVTGKWVDFAPAGERPDRPYQSAIYFGTSGDVPADLFNLLSSNRIREALYVGDSNWTMSEAQGEDRARLMEFLTLQVQLPAPGSQLIKFAVSRHRPPRACLIAAKDAGLARWDELAWWEVERKRKAAAGGNRKVPRTSLWRAGELPRPLGYNEAPWPIVDPVVASTFRRIERQYSRLRPEDVSLGANREVSELWMAEDGELPEADTVAVAEVGNLRGGARHSEPLRRMIWTRDDDNEIVALGDLSHPLRSWIYDRASEFSEHAERDGVDDPERWWGTPWSTLPDGPFVALPVREDLGDPTVLPARTVTGGGILSFQPHLLDVETVAALLTSGPVRAQIRALSPRDDQGRSILTVAVLAALKLPRRVHPLIQDDLKAAYAAGDKDLIRRLASEVYTGNERSVREHRDNNGPSLFPASPTP